MFFMFFSRRDINRYRNKNDHCIIGRDDRLLLLRRIWEKNECRETKYYRRSEPPADDGRIVATFYAESDDASHTYPAIVKKKYHNNEDNIINLTILLRTADVHRAV